MGPGDDQDKRTATGSLEPDGSKAQMSKDDSRPDHHGGLPLTHIDFQGPLQAMLHYKHDMPRHNELGVVDVRALTLSIRSGLHGEVRLALDVIAAVSHEHSISLQNCDELLDSLIDCANDQIELLTDGTSKSSEVLQFPSYQQQVRNVNTQSYMLQETSDSGSLSYKLERAADRLISITTILRNLALPANAFAPVPGNDESLGEHNVIRMIAAAIRYLGTRRLFLRTHQNALDFGKDVVVFLSAIAPSIHLSSKDDALSILHFLLSFAPEPRPNAQDDTITFANYVPATHRYYPHAVDTLAKLLSQDPNRTVYRNIFASDSASSPPFDLLTKAFGLSIAAIPDLAHKRTPRDMAIVCNATLAQGLLAAGILISMIPSTDCNLALSWRRSQDGFALKLQAALSTMADIPSREPHRHRDGRIRADDETYHGLNMIYARGSVVWKKLESARDTEASGKDLPLDVYSPKRIVISA